MELPSFQCELEQFAGARLLTRRKPCRSSNRGGRKEQYRTLSVFEARKPCWLGWLATLTSRDLVSIRPRYLTLTQCDELVAGSYPEQSCGYLRCDRVFSSYSHSTPSLDQTRHRAVRKRASALYPTWTSSPIEMEPLPRRAYWCLV